MPRRPTRTVPTVILHGLNGPRPEHWYTWLAGELSGAGREVRFPALPDSDAPTLDVWLSVLHETLTGLPEDGYDVVCHSLGSVLWLHHVGDTAGLPRPARVALVAPPSPDSDIPEAATFFPVPLDVDTVRAGADGTVLVAADDDPYCPEGAVHSYGVTLKMPTTLIAGGGHLNPESGYGAWPAVLDWCGRDNLAFRA